MLLYHLDVQIDRSRHRFRLAIEGDDCFSLDGDWTVSPPGDLYLGQRSGYWELSRYLDRTGGFCLLDKKMPSVFKFWRWGEEYPSMLAIITIFNLNLGGFLDHRHTGPGTTTVLRGSYHFTWLVTQRFF
jgi:hypothetical protein